MQAPVVRVGVIDAYSTDALRRPRGAWNINLPGIVAFVIQQQVVLAIDCLSRSALNVIQLNAISVRVNLDYFYSVDDDFGAFQSSSSGIVYTI